MTLLFPMVTPGRMTTLEPIHTCAPMCTGSENCAPLSLYIGWMGWPVVEITTFGANIV